MAATQKSGHDGRTDELYAEFKQHLRANAAEFSESRQIYRQGCYDFACERTHRGTRSEMQTAMGWAAKESPFPKGLAKWAARDAFDDME